MGPGLSLKGESEMSIISVYVFLLLDCGWDVISCLKPLPQELPHQDPQTMSHKKPPAFFKLLSSVISSQ